MKRLLILALLVLPLTGRTATPLGTASNPPVVQTAAATFTIQTGVTTTFNSGSITTFASGSTVNFTGATVNGLGSAASDTAFASSWNGVTTIPPTKNAIYDYVHLFDTDDDGKVNVLDLAAGIPKTDASGVLSLAVVGTDFVSPTGTLALGGFGSITGRFGSANLPLNFIAVQATDGSQVTYSTLALAKAAATSGQTVLVGPGSYSITASLAKNGVHWNFAPGATVTYTSSVDQSGIFGDGGTAMSFVVGGQGDFVINSTDDADVSLARATHASSNIVVFARNITQTGSTGTASNGIFSSAGRLSVYADKLEMLGNTDYAIWWANGALFVQINEIISSYITINSSVSATPTGDAIINAQKITGDAAVITSAGSNTDAALWVSSSIIKATNGPVCESTGSSKIYVTAQKLFGWVRLSAGLIYVETEKHSAISAPGSGVGSLIFVQGGELRYHGAHLDPVTFGSDAIRITGGTADLKIGDYTSVATGKGVEVTGGTLYLNGRINTSANSGTNAVTVSGGTANVIESFLTSHASGYDVSRSSGTANIIDGRGTNANGSFTTSGTVNYVSNNVAKADIGSTVQAYDADLDLWKLTTPPSSYAVGDLLYASGANTLSKLADVATGSVLVSGGVTTAPAWSSTPTFTVTNLTGTASININGTVGATTPAAGTFTTGVFGTSATVPEINGGTAANDDITIQGTSHATRTTSYVNLQPNGGLVGIGTAAPSYPLEIVTTANGGTVSTAGEGDALISLTGASFGAGKTTTLGNTLFLSTANNKALIFAGWNGSTNAERARMANGGNFTAVGSVGAGTSFISTTALATPSALSATQFTVFASTVSGAAIMGYGTTGDVTLKNRAGTDALIVGPNTTTITIPGAIITTPQALSGAGAVNVTTSATAFTSTGALQALTLADGVAGQIKTIAHVVDGGSAVLTPTTKSGYSTITFTNVGDAVTLQFFTTAGWCIMGQNGVVVTP